jgi:hypothetical protein
MMGLHPLTTDAVAGWSLLITASWKLVHHHPRTNGGAQAQPGDSFHADYDAVYSLNFSLPDDTAFLPDSFLSQGMMVPT